MSAGKRIVEQLGQKRSRPAPVDATATGGKTQIRVRARQVEQIGARIDEVEARTAPLEPGGAEQWAREFADRARYLLEPLEVIETDTGANEAIARSSPPHREEEHVDYYEAHMSGEGKATLRRYRYNRQERRREPTPMDLSHEQIRRLVDDLDQSCPSSP